MKNLHRLFTLATLAAFSVNCSGPDEVPGDNEQSGGNGASTGVGGDSPSGGNNASGGDTGAGHSGGGPGSGGAAAGGRTASGGRTAAGGDPGVGGQGSDGGSGGSVNGTGGSEGCTVDLNCDPEVPTSTGDFAEDCLNRINQFRACHCLDPLERWAEGEECATANAEFDQGTGQAHSGWYGGACPDDSGPLSSPYYGNATNECPGYNSEGQVIGLCLKQMYEEGAAWADVLGRTPTQSDYDGCKDTCYNTYGHFIAMTSDKYSMVACGIYDEVSGDVWAVQNFN